jgi:ClpX C4-type zinc finger protein
MAFVSALLALEWSSFDSPRPHGDHPIDSAMTEKDDVERRAAEMEVRAAEKELLEAANQLRAIRGEPPLTSLPEPPFCSFCGRSKSEVGALVKGFDAYICAECASEAHRALLRA